MLSRNLAFMACAPLVSAIATISAKGSKFFTSDGEQWYVKGVAYQGSNSDPLANSTQCALDAPLMVELGANVIRCYHVDPSLNHDECMQTFADNGIYAMIDLDTYSSVIVQTAPTWTAAQFGAYQFVMDAFAGYDNVATFFAGNEVVNTVGPNTEAMAYVKASIADMKAYRTAKGYREIPIGYSHADVAGLRPVLQDYLACGNVSQATDFFGLNTYEWCGASSFDQSGYATLLAQTLTYPVPIFMSETGCIVPEPRLWTDQAAVLGPDMDGTWSGAIAYQWVQTENHYGIITYSSDDTSAYDYDEPSTGWLDYGTPLPVTPDFDNLKAEWATLNPTGIAEAAYTPATSTMTCPAYTAGVWEVDPNVALPTLGVNVAIPTSSALAEANYGISGPFSIPVAAQTSQSDAATTTSSTAVSITPVVIATTSSSTTTPSSTPSSTPTSIPSSTAPSSTHSSSTIVAAASSTSPNSAVATSTSASSATAPSTTAASSASAAASETGAANPARTVASAVIGLSGVLAGALCLF